MASKLDAALALAAEGFKVFPVAAGQKKPPLLNGWPQKATSVLSEVRMFWLAVPDANIGIHCEGLLVLDVDIKKGGDDALGKLDITEGLPATRTAHTPSGGRHLIYRLPAGHGGVANSVGLLGPGLDVRSAGGYIVAAGSEVAGGAYTWADPSAPVADAPAWLVERCGQAAPPRQEQAPVATAPDEAVTRAADWLAKQPPAIEGQGGDMRTFAVACGLRDHGVSAEQALLLLAGEWNARCEPPWDHGDLAMKVRNAYRYAEGEAGAKAALPDDFPTLPGEGSQLPSAQQTPHAAQTALQSLASLAGDDTPSAGYVIKGLLYRGSYAEAFGAPGEGKTFAALDWAYHVAAGLPWMSSKVHQGPVLYLAYEGYGGLRKRARALRQKYGPKDVPLFVVSAAYNLRELAGRKALGETISQLPAKPVLIVVDTFARALMGGDENSAQDVGAFNTAVAALIQSTGACVLILHHSGKDKSRGARGSSALLGALDTEIEIDSGQIIARKQRDIDLGMPIGFKLVPVLVGLDEDGDTVTSCVLEACALGARPLERLTGQPQTVLKVLADMAPDNRPVLIADWQAKCKPYLPEGRAGKAFSDAKLRLAQKGYILFTEDGNAVVRKMT